VLGKHTRRITCGAWSRQNLLALGGDDRLLTVSNTEGDTLFQFTVQGNPSDIQFSEVKSDERRNVADNTVSSHVISVLKTIYTCDNSSTSNYFVLCRDGGISQAYSPSNAEATSSRAQRTFPRAGEVCINCVAQSS